MDEKEETGITISSFITHPSYFLCSLRASVSPCLTSFYFYMRYELLVTIYAYSGPRTLQASRSPPSRVHSVGRNIRLSAIL